MKPGTKVRDGRGYEGEVVDVPGLVPGGTLVPVQWTIYPGRGTPGVPNTVPLDADNLEVVPEKLKARDFKIVDEGRAIYLKTRDGWYVAEIRPDGLSPVPGLGAVTNVPFMDEAFDGENSIKIVAPRTPYPRRS